MAFSDSGKKIAPEPGKSNPAGRENRFFAQKNAFPGCFSEKEK